MNLVLRQLKQHNTCKMCAQEQLYRRTYMFSDGRQWCWIHWSFRLVRIHVSQRVCVEKLWTKGRLCINFTQTDRQTDRCKQTDKQTHEQTDWHRCTQTQTIFKGYIRLAFCLCVKMSLCEAIHMTGSFSCKSILFSYEKFCAVRGLILKEKRKLTRKWPVYLRQMLSIRNGHKIHQVFFAHSYFEIAMKGACSLQPQVILTTDL